MRLLLFLIISYILLPFSTLYIYRWELFQLYPPFIATDSTLASFPGVYLFFLFMTQIILGSRPKFLEKGTGLNVIMRVHGNTTLATLVFLVIHYQIHKFTVSFTSFTGRAIALIFFFVVCVTIFFWLNNPLSNLPLIRSVRLWLHTKLQYQHFRLIHNLMAFATILVAIHISSTNFAQDSVYAINIVYAYFIFSTSVYVYHKFIKRFVIARRVWEVKDIVHETRDEILSPEYSKIVTIQLTQISGTPLQYHAGQFAFIKFTSGALVRWGEEHPFSFSSSPEAECVSLTIQDEGDFTHRLVNECCVGDRVVMDAPYGVFCVPSPHNERKKDIESLPDKEPLHIIGIAGGIGVTPYIGWLEYIKNFKNSTMLHFSLLWMRREQDDGLAQRVCEYNSCPNIDIEMFSTYKNKPLHVKNIKECMRKNTHFYICASPKQISVFTKLLRSIGIRKKYIHSEKFSMF